MNLYQHRDTLAFYGIPPIQNLPNWTSILYPSVIHTVTPFRAAQSSLITLSREPSPHCVIYTVFLLRTNNIILCTRRFCPILIFPMNALVGTPSACLSHSYFFSCCLLRRRFWHAVSSLFIFNCFHRLPFFQRLAAYHLPYFFFSSSNLY